MKNRHVLVKVEVKHQTACRALHHYFKGTWSTPWSGCLHRTAPEVWRNYAGNKRPGGCHYPYLVFTCNDTDCPARLIIRSEAVLTLFTQNRLPL